MDAADFPEFYKAVHDDGCFTGFHSFDWQNRLVAKAAGSGWPSSLPLPTSSGKTSVIDVAVFTLAMQAGLPISKRSARMRTFFVVDRRFVVDDATAHAMRLAQALEESHNPVVREVARRLLSFGGSAPLRVARMRGGTFPDTGWVQEPNQPSVIVSTVDQVGSRLLFRGYGVSNGSKPVQAAMAACDSLYLVDEAHISAPFVVTLKGVADLQCWAEVQVSPPLTVVSMSATPAEFDDQGFALSEKDRNDPILGPRLQVAKLADLREVDSADGFFAKRMAEAAVELAANIGRPCVVGVVANRVRTARAVYEILSKAPTTRKTQKDRTPVRSAAVLMTGRVRPYDRDRMWNPDGEWLPYIRVRGRSSLPSGLNALYIVATQTIEVGADLDFDGLVSEAAPIGSLRQRFGRLNRLGRPEHRPGLSQAVILFRGKYDPDKVPDPVYGQMTTATWGWLLEHSGANHVVDFGITAMDALVRDFPPPGVVTGLVAPLLLPAFMDLLVQTNPRPTVEPEPAPFLHGAGAALSTDVEIVWRADLLREPDGRTPAAEWVETVKMFPPLSGEALPVPIWEARNWLAGAASADVSDADAEVQNSPGETRTVESLDERNTDGDGDSAKDAGDEGQGTVKSKEQYANSKSPRGGRARTCVVWRGKDDVRIVTNPKQLRPGDTVVVPAEYGGCDQFGWDPESAKPVTDVAEACAFAAVRQGVGRILKLRLHPEILKRLAGVDKLSGEVETALGILAAGYGGDDQDIAEALDRVLDWLAGSSESWVADLVGTLSPRDALEPTADPAVVISKRFTVERPVFEDNAGDRESFCKRRITLEEHSAAVADTVRRFAVGCGLPDGLATDLDLAGQLHDIGKLDPRFQVILQGGDWVAALAQERPLAKGARLPEHRSKPRLNERHRYPQGMRHEAASAGLLLDSMDKVDADDPELVVSLIATHHGFFRDVLTPAADPKSAQINGLVCGIPVDGDAAEVIAKACAALPEFRARLVEKYGWWGLAFLEAMLRVADWRVSGEEDSR